MEKVSKQNRYRLDFNRQMYKYWLNRKGYKISKFGKINRKEELHSRLRDRLRILERKTKG